MGTKPAAAARGPHSPGLRNPGRDLIYLAKRLVCGAALASLKIDSAEAVPGPRPWGVVHAFANVHALQLHCLYGMPAREGNEGAGVEGPRSGLEDDDGGLLALLRDLPEAHYTRLLPNLLLDTETPIFDRGRNLWICWIPRNPNRFE